MAVIGTLAIIGITHPYNKSKVSVAVNPLEATTIVLPAEPTKDELKEAIRFFALKYSVSPELLLKIADCESGIQIDPPHNNQCRGIFQYKEMTWDFVLEKGWCKGEMMNPMAQIECTARLFSMGYESWWECTQIIK